MSKAAIIGAGRIAYSLCGALLNCGIDDIYVFSRSPKSAKALADTFSLPHHQGWPGILPYDLDYCFIAVPDQFITNISDSLAGFNCCINGTIFIHLSGAVSVHALSALTDVGAKTGSIHIMQSFPTRAVVSIDNCAAAVESVDLNTYQQLANLCRQLNLKPFRLASEKKSLYHIAGVYLANYLIGNLAAAGDLFDSINAEGVDFWDLAMPIILSTLSNARSGGIINALSGPVERGSIEVVKSHIETLTGSSHQSAIQPEDYILKALQALRVARLKNPDQSEHYDKLEEFLCSYKKLL